MRLCLCALTVAACATAPPAAAPSSAAATEPASASSAPGAPGATAAAPATAPPPLPPVEPVAGADNVQFASKPGGRDRAPTTVDALVFRPASPAPASAVVALHGCEGLYDAHGRIDPLYLAWSTRLRDAGFVVVWPDSFRSRGVESNCHVKKGATAGVTTRERLDDAYGALAWLDGRPFVTSGDVAVMGWAGGANVALFAIADAVGDHAGRAEHATRAFKTAIAFYPACAPLLDDKWHTKVPLEIFVGELDDWTPAAPCMTLTQTMRSEGLDMETVVYRRAYHRFDAPDERVHVVGAANGTPSGRATVGTDRTAREDALARVPDLIKRRLAAARAAASR